MTRLAVSIAFAVGVALGSASCTSDNPAETASKSRIQFLRHVDHECLAGAESSDKAGLLDCYLADYSLQEDTLALLIHFGANCCPKFIEEVGLGAGTIDIELTDVFEGCDCYCEFENEFIFYLPEASDVTINFVNAGSTGGTICEFDTLIALGK